MSRALAAEVAFAIEPIPGTARVTSSAMAAMKQRIFFMDTPLLFAFFSKRYVFHYPAATRNVLRRMYLSVYIREYTCERAANLYLSGDTERTFEGHHPWTIEKELVLTSTGKHKSHS